MAKRKSGLNLLVAASIGLALVGSPSAEGDITEAGPVTLVSVGNGGATSNGVSGGGAMSADGRYVAFYSEAANLVEGDDNGIGDVFLRDVLSGETELVSVSTDGAQANRPSYVLGVSDDGRHVLFGSDAANLVEGDRAGFGSFVRDRESGTTSAVSIDETGAALDGLASGRMSADGRFVAFAAYEYDDEGRLGAGRVYLHDVVAGESQLVASIPNETDGVLLQPGSPVISGDGMLVAFASDNAAGDVQTFVYDRATLETVAIPAPDHVAPVTNIVPNRFSEDGRWLLVIAGTVGSDDGGMLSLAAPYIYDRSAGEYTAVPVPGRVPPLDVHPNPVYSAVLSADGRYVAYMALIAQYDAYFGGVIEVQGTVIFDRLNGSFASPLTNYLGHDLVHGSNPAAISEDGNIILFSTSQDWVHPIDGNGVDDAFLFRRDADPESFEYRAFVPNVRAGQGPVSP